MQNKPKRLTAQQIRQEQQAREMVGQRYGSLTVVEYLGLRQTSGGSWQRFLRLRCDCGTEIETSIQSITQKTLRAIQRGETQATMRWACDECQRRAKESYIVLECPGYVPDRRHR